MNAVTSGAMNVGMTAQTGGGTIRAATVAIAPNPRPPPAARIGLIALIALIATSVRSARAPSACPSAPASR